MAFHFNPATGQVDKCKAQKEPCPFGGKDGLDNHFLTRKEAASAYEATQGSSVGAGMRRLHRIPTPNKGWGEKFHASVERNYPGVYPKEVLDQVVKFAERKPFAVQAVLPQGSQLYGTRDPQVPVHDYDFLILAEPHPYNCNVEKVFQGEMDVTVVSLDRISTLLPTDVTLAETLLGYQYGAKSLYEVEEGLAPLGRRTFLGDSGYLHLLDSSIRSPKQAFTEPANREDDRANFGKFKHSVRRMIYQRRWGTGASWDPRLTGEELDLYLSCLREGRVLFDR